MFMHQTVSTAMREMKERWNTQSLHYSCKETSKTFLNQSSLASVRNYNRIQTRIESCQLSRTCSIWNRKWKLSPRIAECLIMQERSKAFHEEPNWGNENEEGSTRYGTMPPSLIGWHCRQAASLTGHMIHPHSPLGAELLIESPTLHGRDPLTKAGFFRAKEPWAPPSPELVFVVTRRVIPHALNIFPFSPRFCHGKWFALVHTKDLSMHSVCLDQQQNKKKK